MSAWLAEVQFRGAIQRRLDLKPQPNGHINQDAVLADTLADLARSKVERQRLNHALVDMQKEGPSAAQPQGLPSPPVG